MDYCNQCTDHEECRATGCSNPRRHPQQHGVSGGVVSLDDYRPHSANYIACVKCGKDWVGVVPVGANDPFECPSCGEMAGEIVETDNADFFARFMNVATEPEDIQHRTKVLLNAKRMGR